MTGPDGSLSHLEHWSYEVDSPFRPPHELLALADEVTTGSGAWTGTGDQVLFREAVLRAHVERSRKRKGPPHRDLAPHERAQVSGTDISTGREAAAAAGRLLAAANAALATARATGDDDASRTERVALMSGYRGRDHQEKLWRRYFPKYYNRTRTERAAAPGGPHGPAAVAYLLETFGIPKWIAAPGYSNHQNGSAVDFRQHRRPGAEIGNSSSAVRAWRNSWFHRWLVTHARSFGFEPYEREPWHWEHRAAPRDGQREFLDLDEQDPFAPEESEGEDEELLLTPEEPGSLEEEPADEEAAFEEAALEEAGYEEPGYEMLAFDAEDAIADEAEPEDFQDDEASAAEAAEAAEGWAVPTEHQAAPATTRVLVRNALFGWTDPVVQCDIEVAGTGVVGRTNAQGVVTPNLAAVPDGDHQIRFRPASSWTGPVGPATAASVPRPDRIWLPLDARITVTGHRVTAVTGVHLELAGDQLTCRMQPAWIRSPNRAPRPTGVTATLIVVHHTAGCRIGPALNTFRNPKSTSAHYVIDVDGRIVKMVHESEQAVHTGSSHWSGRDDNNARSIGIEVVHRGGNDGYPAAQTTALTQLLQAILAAHPGIAATSIVGHSDIATHDKPRRLGRKSGDPGLEFDWAALRANRLGIGFRVGPPAPSPLGDFFTAFPGERLRLGDRDTGRNYAGRARPAAPAAVVAALQTLLGRIGYWCPRTGRYDAATDSAVEMFQQHFMGSTQPRPACFGEVDARTATLIQRVA